MKKFIVLFILLTSAVYAQEIVEYGVETKISEAILQETISFMLVNTYQEGLSEFTYPFSGPLNDLEVVDSSGNVLRTSPSFRGGKTYVTTFFEEPIPPGQNYTVIYKFNLQGQITIKENTYILTDAHSLLANVKNFDLTIALPEGFGLVEVSPGPNKIVSDGRRHILSWQLGEPIPIGMRSFKVIVLYEKLILPWWVEKEKYIYGLIFVAVVISTVGVLYPLVKKRGVEGKIDVLKDDEQRIMKLIVEKDGIDQRDIQSQTGFSKTKVSKILSELEKRGVIKKEPSGRRNKVFLAEKIKET